MEKFIKKELLIIVSTNGGERMEFVIETLEEVSPKHPCSSKPLKAMAPGPIIIGIIAY